MLLCLLLCLLLNLFLKISSAKVRLFNFKKFQF